MIQTNDDLQYNFQPPKKKPAAAGGGKAVKGKKKASTAAHDNEEPTEPEMSVRNTVLIRFCHLHCLHGKPIKKMLIYIDQV